MDEPQINIEEIMQNIRREILSRKATHTGEHLPMLNLTGKRFPPEFYEHLYQAGLTYNQIDVAAHVTPVNIPLIGALVQKLRGKLHELVLFYVNRLAANQIQVNTQLLQAVTLIAEEMETQDTTKKD